MGGGAHARTQVLTVHSNVRIENHTSHGLRFVVHMLRSGKGVGQSTGRSATVAVPGAGPLAPGLQCYLPVAAARWSPVAACDRSGRPPELLPCATLRTKNCHFAILGPPSVVVHKRKPKGEQREGDSENAESGGYLLVFVGFCFESRCRSRMSLPCRVCIYARASCALNELRLTS